MAGYHGRLGGLWLALLVLCACVYAVHGRISDGRIPGVSVALPRHGPISATEPRFRESGTSEEEKLQTESRATAGGDGDPPSPNLPARPLKVTVASATMSIKPSYRARKMSGAQLRLVAAEARKRRKEKEIAVLKNQWTFECRQQACLTRFQEPGQNCDNPFGIDRPKIEDEMIAVAAAHFVDRYYKSYLDYPKDCACSFFGGPIHKLLIFGKKMPSMWGMDPVRNLCFGINPEQSLCGLDLATTRGSGRFTCGCYDFDYLMRAGFDTQTKRKKSAIDLADAVNTALIPPKDQSQWNDLADLKCDLFAPLYPFKKLKRVQKYLAVQLKINLESRVDPKLRKAFGVILRQTMVPKIISSFLELVAKEWPGIQSLDLRPRRSRDGPPVRDGEAEVILTQSNCKDSNGESEHRCQCLLLEYRLQNDPQPKYFVSCYKDEMFINELNWRTDVDVLLTSNQVLESDASGLVELLRKMVYKYVEERVEVTPPAAKRLVVVGDLHGDLERSMLVLQMAGLVSIVKEKNGEGADTFVYKWIAEEGTKLIQVGDVFDRGVDDMAISKILKSFGDKVVRVMGNHEFMVATGNWQYKNLYECYSEDNDKMRKCVNGLKSILLESGGSVFNDIVRMPVVHIEHIGSHPVVFAHGGLTDEIPNYLRWKSGKNFKGFHAKETFNTPAQIAKGITKIVQQAIMQSMTRMKMSETPQVFDPMVNKDPFDDNVVHSARFVDADYEKSRSEDKLSWNVLATKMCSPDPLPYESRDLLYMSLMPTYVGDDSCTKLDEAFRALFHKEHKKKSFSYHHVIAHTPVDVGGGPVAMCGNRLIDVDTGISRWISTEPIEKDFESMERRYTMSPSALEIGPTKGGRGVEIKKVVLYNTEGLTEKVEKSLTEKGVQTAPNSLEGTSEEKTATVTKEHVQICWQTLKTKPTNGGRLGDDDKDKEGSSVARYERNIQSHKQWERAECTDASSLDGDLLAGSFVWKYVEHHFQQDPSGRDETSPSSSYRSSSDRHSSEIEDSPSDIGDLQYASAKSTDGNAVLRGVVGARVGHGTDTSADSSDTTSDTSADSSDTTSDTSADSSDTTTVVDSSDTEKTMVGENERSPFVGDVEKAPSDKRPTGSSRGAKNVPNLGVFGLTGARYGYGAGWIYNR